MIPVTERFEGLAAAYDRHRPDYPPSLFARIVAAAPAAPPAAADIAAGTGISTARLLGALPGHWRIEAVEPGADMRRVLADRFATDPRVRVRDATGEATGLAPASLALVTVCTAFHWLDRARFLPEAARILAPGGALAVVRNRREDQPVLAAFDAFLRTEATEDIEAVRAGHRGQEEALRAAAGFGGYEEMAVAWARELDEAGLIALYLTRSVARTVVARLGRAETEARLSALYRAELGTAPVTLRYEATARLVRRAA